MFRTLIISTKTLSIYILNFFSYQLNQRKLEEVLTPKLFLYFITISTSIIPTTNHCFQNKFDLEGKIVCLVKFKLFI